MRLGLPDLHRVVGAFAHPLEDEFKRLERDLPQQRRRTVGNPHVAKARAS